MENRRCMLSCILGISKNIKGLVLRRVKLVMVKKTELECQNVTHVGERRTHVLLA